MPDKDARTARRISKGTSGSALAAMIDHTLLRPDASRADILKLCAEAVEWGFHAVCISPYFVGPARDAVGDSPVRVCTVVGFPLGSTYSEAKVVEARVAAAHGAHEIDMVINMGAAKSGEWDVVWRDISEVISSAPGLVHKVIIEACYLDREEKARAIEAVLEAGADFIKTSTGMGCGGATPEDVRLISGLVGGRAGIKAAGGIRTLDQALELIDAGATRIGTSSSVSIMKELKGGR